MAKKGLFSDSVELENFVPGSVFEVDLYFILSSFCYSGENQLAVVFYFR